MFKPLSALFIAAIAIAPNTAALARGPGRGGPADNIGQRHPNLAAAQDLVNKAFARVEAAQQANEFDLGGHAKKAKEALKVAADEMKLAAQYANRK